ncbi:MAG TPA: tetratricopeptide repeat protein [Pyrinomonadaceae bacterium]|nr:tetratricopeptide repeat protein [Pyrinomonadaceae bacterium]
MLTEYTSPTDPEALFLSQMTLAVSPDNPRARLLAARLYYSSLDTNSEKSALHELEQAVKASPNDYRIMLELARALEQSGNSEAAKAAFQSAISLAPEYSIPHWQYGNYLIRAGETDEAINQLRLAAKYNGNIREASLVAAWPLLGERPDLAAQLLPAQSDSFASLALFFARQKLGKEALRFWNMLLPEEKKKFDYHGKTSLEALYKGQQYDSALEFAVQTGASTTSRLNAVTNPGFELPLPDQDIVYFDWQIRRGGRDVEVSLSRENPHSGTKALKIQFRGFKEQLIGQIAQLVAVTPGKRWRLKYWMRSSGLKGFAMPMLQIVEPGTSKLIAAGAPIVDSEMPWRQFELEFTMPEDSQGFVIMLGREACTEDCVISGNLWLDDLELEQV